MDFVLDLADYQHPPYDGMEIMPDIGGTEAGQHVFVYREFAGAAVEFAGVAYR